MGAEEDRRFQEMENARRFENDQQRYQTELRHQTEREKERRESDQRQREQFQRQQEEQQERNRRDRAARERESEQRQHGAASGSSAWQPNSASGGYARPEKRPSALVGFLKLAAGAAVLLVIIVAVAPSTSNPTPTPTPERPTPAPHAVPLSETPQPSEPANVRPAADPLPAAESVKTDRAVGAPEPEGRSSDEARKAVLRAKVARLNSAIDHNERGDRLCKVGQYDEAAVEFRQSYELTKDPSPFIGMGNCLANAKDYAGAAEAFRIYLNLAPSDDPQRALISAVAAKMESMK
jgi:hypothetical protein